jgi:hypothetical protein
MDKRSTDDVHGMDYGDYLELVNTSLRAMSALEDGETVDQLVERFDEAMLARLAGMMQDVQAVVHLARRGLQGPM